MYSGHNDIRVIREIRTEQTSIRDPPCTSVFVKIDYPCRKSSVYLRVHPCSLKKTIRVEEASRRFRVNKKLNTFVIFKKKF